MSLQRHIVYLEKNDPAERDPYPLLLEEYKIIQEKIDKLGEDKFKVRSWCFTLLTGGAVATKYLNLLDNSNFTPLILAWAFVAVLAFHFIELRQRQIGKRLGYRAAAIEWSWEKSATLKNSTPQMARDLIRSGRYEDSPFKIAAILEKLHAELYCDYPETPPARPSKAKVLRRHKYASKRNESQYAWIQYLTVNSEDLFYFIQYGLIITFAVLFIWGSDLNKKPVLKQEHEAPEIGQKINDLNVDGVKPTDVGGEK